MLVRRTVLATLVTGLAAGAAGAPTAAAQAPAGCGVYGGLLDRSGVRSAVSVLDGAVTRSGPVAGDRWSFQPAAITTLGSAGGPGGGFTNEIAVRGDGAVFSFRRNFRGSGPAAATAATAAERRLGASWPRTRALTGAARDLLRLSGDRLLRHRYRPGGGGHFTVGAGTAVRGADFGRLRSLATHQADRAGRTVLYATTGRGALRRLVVDGRRVTSDVRLRASGFRGVDTIRLGFCNRGGSRPILTRSTSGELRLFHDPSPDADGSDITGGAVVASGVGGLLY